MGDELRHLNSACGCVVQDEEICENNNTCCGFGGSWIWIILIFLFFCGCGGSGLLGSNTCSIDCSDFLTIIIILLVLNCICGDGEGGLLGGLFR